MSSFTLASDGTIENQDFIVPTTSSGGGANQAVPAPFNANLLAILDSSTGFIEVWKRSEDGKGATVIAHLDVPGGAEGAKCCSNAVWYS